MNQDQRYRCPDHSTITVGATEGETAPPACQFDGKAMQPVTAPSREQPTRDVRRVRPPRGESRPL